MLTKEFLKSKIVNEPYHKAHTGNIYQLTEKVFTFGQSNFLPGNDGKLCGHFTFYFNSETFDYLLYKHGGYGSLTYMTESEDESFVTELIPRERIKIDSIVADKILGAYFYCDASEHCNHWGKNLIIGLHDVDKTDELNGEYIGSIHKYSCIFRYSDPSWVKPKDLEAVKILHT